MKRYQSFVWAAAAAILAGCGDASTRAQAICEPEPVKVVRRDLVGYVRMPGALHVPPGNDAVVTAPYRAPVERVLAAVGQKVKKGEVLFDMSVPNVESAYEANRAALKEAETALANAEVQAEAPLRTLERDLAQARSTERTLREQARQTGDGTLLDQATQRRVELENALTQARAEAKAALLPYKQQVEAARGTFRQARGSVKQTSVRAPISGTVLEIRAKDGEEVGTAGRDVLARIVDLGAIQVKATFTDAEDAYIEDGKAVVLYFEGMDDQPFEGRILSLRKLPDQDGGVRREATVSFRNDQGLVKPGMRVASVAVKIGAVENALTVPVEAIGKDSTGKPYVHVLTAGTWKPTVVVPGLSDGKFTEIKQGVREGDTVQSPLAPARS